MSVGHAAEEIRNPFLIRPVGRLFLGTALPMAVVLSMSGLLNIVDGIFVGRFVGAKALAAISLGFPLVMLLTALSTLIGGGMSSLLARRLGAGDRAGAIRILTRAQGLALLIGLLLPIGAIALGAPLLDWLAAGDTEVAQLAAQYLRILYIGAPLQLVLGLHADALRNEGRAATVALLSIGVNLLNMASNAVAIILLGLGLTGAALGTVVAQALGLGMLIALRQMDRGKRDRRLLPFAFWRSSAPNPRWAKDGLRDWGQILRLGLPLCLGLMGTGVMGCIMLIAIGRNAQDSAPLIAAYGIVTRILGLAYLPQLAIALTTQSITGHTHGAGQRQRCQEALNHALLAAFIWCGAVALGAELAAQQLGRLFTADAAVIAAVGTMLRPMMACYFLAGPALVLAMYFQALGQPLRAALLTLVKPWLLLPALIAVLLGALPPMQSGMLFPSRMRRLPCSHCT